jgi:two-component system, NtrC family, response regulator
LGLAHTQAAPTLNLRLVRRNAESYAIWQALVRTSGNVSRAAEVLGVTRPTLYDLMQKYEIRHEDSDGRA